MVLAGTHYDLHGGIGCVSIIIPYTVLVTIDFYFKVIFHHAEFLPSSTNLIIIIFNCIQPELFASQVISISTLGPDLVHFPIMSLNCNMTKNEKDFQNVETSTVIFATS